MSIYIAHCRKEPPVRCGSGVFARADVVEYLLENTSEGDESKVDLGNNAQTWWSTCWKTRRKATSRRWTSVTTRRRGGVPAGKHVGRRRVEGGPW